VLDYNHVAGLEAAFAEHGTRIAGIMFEAVAGNMGVVVPTQAFLDALTGLSKRHGALLICDEVMSGFRVAYGGAQQRLGFEPDLTTLGKIVGGGLPVGAYGGKAHIMEHMLPAGDVFQAGTLSGNPLATAAGIATLRVLKERPPYDRLEQLDSQLEQGLHHAATAANIHHTIGRIGSMLTLFFSPQPVVDWRTASRCDTARFAAYFWGLADRGVYVPCSQYEATFISAAHTEDDIAKTVDAAAEVFAGIDA
jgi:glutamate-1-semialdehyde 2,1-aminomutase